MFTPENRQKAEALVDRYPVARSALLPLLHLVQHQDGYVTDDGVAECAQLLGLTRAEVGAVATFYTMYKRAPLGRHLVSVCTNFACVVRGADEVYERLREHLGIGHDETTGDGAVTLEHAECLGNCEGAPVVTVDYLNYEAVTPDHAVQIVDACRAGEPPQPTRGFVPTGIRDVQHRLAGIGPLDPALPGQRLGLSTKEHGAPPQPGSGPGVAVRHLQLTAAEVAASVDGEDGATPAVMDQEGEEATSSDATRTGVGDYAGSETRPDEGTEEAQTEPDDGVAGERTPDDASVSRSSTEPAEREDTGA